MTRTNVPRLLPGHLALHQTLAAECFMLMERPETFKEYEAKPPSAVANNCRDNITSFRDVLATNFYLCSGDLQDRCL
ncbi:hypothetical protein DM01DRAFT_1375276 [Hesseltinella vesiculosa]|uniref:Uncharacterized protein n=1 Tax=Hesseltinella vesiculosa TaxID=101127 RepID=A0A1X2GDN3_9FUNG|nr:hypothetical protein DM01DRAFT_1375276 [Hesseltinella vesiculosa]